MLLHYGDGRVFEGILMSLKGDRMRVAIKDADDIAEYRLECGVWISECCETVTFEFPTAIFQAVGIVPDGANLSVESDFLWHRNAAVTLTADPLN